MTYDGAIKITTVSRQLYKSKVIHMKKHLRNRDLALMPSDDRRRLQMLKTVLTVIAALNIANKYFEPSVDAGPAWYN